MTVARNKSQTLQKPLLEIKEKRHSTPTSTRYKEQDKASMFELKSAWFQRMIDQDKMESTYSSSKTQKN